MPFAGMINAPANMSKMKYAEKNFAECTQNILTDITDITSDIMSRILNIMTPLIETIITTKSMLGKSNGVVTAVIYTLFGVYLSIKSLIGSILELVIILLIAMAAAIVLLFFIPIVGDILAAAGIIFFIAVAIPMGHLIGFSNNILNVHASRGVPSVPHG